MRGDYCHSGLPEGEMAKYYGQNCQNLEKQQNTGLDIAIQLLRRATGNVEPGGNGQKDNVDPGGNGQKRNMKHFVQCLLNLQKDNNAQ